MSEPFLAEVRIVGFNFAPRGWSFCDGQILPINQNQSLYSLLGTTYGGDGRTSFALPDLRGRTPIHVGDGFQQGQKSGEEAHFLAANEMPNHGHTLNATTSNASTGAAGSQPSNKVWANSPISIYHDYAAGNAQNMATNTVANGGGGQGHDNMQPFLALNYCIALRGLFPSRN